MWKRCLTFSLVMLLFSASANAREDRLVIDFQPAEGTWVRDFRMLARVTINDQPTGATTVHTVHKLEIRKTKSGWSIECTPDKVAIDGLESSLDRVIQEILLNQSYRYQISPKGQLISVDGFDTIQAEVEKRVAKEDQPAVLQVLNAEAQRWKIANQWDVEQGWIYGRELKQGENFGLKRLLAPPNAPIMGLKQVSTIESVDSGEKGTDCVITFTSATLPTEETQLGQLRDMQISEKGRRSFDSANGMPLSEETERIITIVINTPQGPLSQVRIETRRIELKPLLP